MRSFNSKEKIPSVYIHFGQVLQRADKLQCSGSPVFLAGFELKLKVTLRDVSTEILSTMQSRSAPNELVAKKKENVSAGKLNLFPSMSEEERPHITFLVRK
jgi:hypothetical protein